MPADEGLPAQEASEAELAGRFTIRTEGFVHGDFSVELILPESADALIDDTEFNRDERLPYWAELWPAARVLARHLLDEPPGGPVLELGCGLALPSLAARHRGTPVLATDYYSEALEFARANAIRNGYTIDTAVLDWRDPSPGLAPRPLILAADVLYERRNVDALLSVLPRVMSRGGRLVLADPGRAHAEAFEREASSAGWKIRERLSVREASAPGREVTVRVLEVRLPGRTVSGRRNGRRS